MLTDEALNEYVDRVDKDGNFCGDKEAKEKVSARCMDKVCEANISRKNSEQIIYPFMQGLNGNDGAGEPQTEVSKLLKEYAEVKS